MDQQQKRFHQAEDRDRQKLLELLLGEEGLQTPSSQEIVPHPYPATIPLSFAQQRMWFLEQWEPGTPRFNVRAAWRLRGPLALGALEYALHEIVRRHESLRTCFPAAQGVPRQDIAPQLLLSLPVIDLSSYSANQRDQLIQTLLHEACQRPFDLTRLPLLRCMLLRLSPSE
ncbi:MAG TPA: condensation domain-containing protein, partial [Ktedonobacteraceae bacterium]